MVFGCSDPPFALLIDDRFPEPYFVFLAEAELRCPRAHIVEHHTVDRKVEDHRVGAAALGPVVVDRAKAIDEKYAVAVDVIELVVVVVVDEEEVAMPCGFKPRHVRLGQGHPRVEAAYVAVVIETRVAASHVVLCTDQA